MICFEETSGLLRSKPTSSKSCLWLARAMYLSILYRRVCACAKSLPAPLGNALYLGGVLEAGQMRSPDGATITRYDAYFGLVVETPFGVISVAPAIGNGGERKLNFTIGKLF